MARRRKEDDAERRTDFLGVQLTPSEKAELVARAESIGCSVSEFARIVLLSDLKKPAPSVRSPDAIRELSLEIRRVGTNINQLAHVANQTNQLSEVRALREVSAQIVEALQKVMTL